jgi:hypothetical protein
VRRDHRPHSCRTRRAYASGRDGRPGRDARCGHPLDRGGRPGADTHRPEAHLGAQPEATLSTDPEAAYYQAVEEFFVKHRGDPLFLSNADWLLIRRWRKLGIPLRIVLRGIRDALDAHAHSWGRERKVGSLRYCESEVEVARERWERALAGEAGPQADLGATLEAFAKALETKRALGPEAAAIAGRVAGRLRALAAGHGLPRDVEESLTNAEGELVAALRRQAGAAGLVAIEARVDATLAPYRERMPAKVFGDLRAQSVTRQLLAAHGLPRLSLFDL